MQFSPNSKIYKTHFNSLCSCSWKCCDTCKRFSQNCVCSSYLFNACYMLLNLLLYLFFLVVFSKERKNVTPQYAVFSPSRYSLP